MKLFKQLRDRMYPRMLRYQDAPPNQRDQLIPMTAVRYGAWEDNARQARRDYMAGKIGAEEFLCRIDTTHNPASYNKVKFLDFHLKNENPGIILVLRSL